MTMLTIKKRTELMAITFIVVKGTAAAIIIMVTFVKQSINNDNNINNVN